MTARRGPFPLRPVLCGAVLLALSLAVSAQTPPTSTTGYALRGEDGLIRAYDAIMDARFDEVPAELRRACGPAPAEACEILEGTAIWWRILLDPDSRAFDDEFTAVVEKAIDATAAWTARAPDDPEAWFYHGAAHALRVQLRVLRGEKLSAARDGKRIKEALERAIALAPGLDDAYFGIGLYRYYADVAPAAARFFRFLLLLPGGNREEGLEQMRRARDRGRLLEGEADYQLHLIYLWYERDATRAIELLRSLQQRHPTNPLFLMQLADVQHTYLHDTTASLATWRTLLATAREGRVSASGLADARARLGIAQLLEALHQTDHAIEQLDALIEAEPAAPYSALALGYLRLGEAHDRLGARERAIEAYRQVAAAAPADDRYGLARDAERRIRSAPDADSAEAYRLSLAGWRRLERKDLEGAAAALERALELRPRSPVARFRYGRVLLADRLDAAALAQFEAAIREVKRCPPPIAGMAYLDAARLHERAGRRDQALSYYRVAATLFGAAQETHAAAARALARLTGGPVKD